MSLRDSLLPTVARARAIPSTLGLRRVSVSLATLTYSAPLGTAGGVWTESLTTLTPTPRVSEPAPGDPSFAGGGVVTDSTGATVAVDYVIGPITPAYAGGGYDLASLALPSTDTSTWQALKLTGDGLQSGGEYFRVVRARQSPLHVYLDVTRTTRPPQP